MSSRLLKAAFVWAIATLALPSAARAACTSEAYHQFDFFVGHWKVYDAKGKFVGTDLVEKRVNGCAIYEQYTDPGGGVGIGLSGYQPAKGQWHQDFMSDDGLVVSLDGAKTKDAAMLMSGVDYPASGTRRLDRGLWLLHGDVVEELWTVSTDGGKTWKTQFRGFFHRTSAGAS
jgi:hypothetical protein